MVLKFMQAFGLIILRKAQQKIRIFQLKNIQKNLVKIRKVIKSKIDKNKNNKELVAECEAELN